MGVLLKYDFLSISVRIPTGDSQIRIIQGGFIYKGANCKDRLEYGTITKDSLETQGEQSRAAAIPKSDGIRRGRGPWNQKRAVQSWDAPKGRKAPD